MKAIITYLFLTIGFFSFAQIPPGERVPLDTAVRYGKLKNGMTYYIMHNEEPKHRVSFYLAQNVGALLENDDQNGLAHFLEHMAFNGTEHFKGKGIINFLGKHGVAFGQNINAFTEQDKTVYILSNVPADHKGLTDSCLLVLHDWSHYLLLTDEEIDAERGVVSEEWRNHQSAGFRIENKQNEALFSGSKYAVRDVIGDINIIQHFKYQVLRDFYHDWYRTDLQAIIVVGDVDVNAVEQSVKKIFSEIPPVKDPKERKNFFIPDNKEPIYGLVTDKEAQSFSTMVMFKMDGVVAENKDRKYMENMYVRSLFNNMMINRISERMQQESCSFTSGVAKIDRMVRTKDAAIISVTYKEGKGEPALRDLATLIQQVRYYGFTQPELDRAKAMLLFDAEKAYKMRDKINNDNYAKEFWEHYIDNTPVPGVEYKYMLVKDLMPGITLADVKELAQNFLRDENIVIVVSGPQKEGLVYPAKEDVLKVLNEVKNTKPDGYVDSYIEKPLLNEIPPAGKIVKRKEIRAGDLKGVELTLNNGITVYCRHSDIEKEVVRFTAHSWGGKSLLEQNLLINYPVFMEFMRAYGLGDFSANDLRKKLTGKNAAVGFGIDELSEVLNGSASPKEMETMFQLLYLRFTKPRFDEKAYNAVYARIQERLKSSKKNEFEAFQDSVIVTMSDHHSRSVIMDENLFSKVSFEGVKQIYESRFGDPADFVFTFSGNFDEKELESNIEKYIASLPVHSKKEKYTDNGIRPPRANTENYFFRDLQNKKATVYINLHNKYTYNQENNLYAYVIAQLLVKRYIDEMREKAGGIYSATVVANPQQRPYSELQFAIQFNCAPENTDKMKGMALAEIDQLINGKIIESDLDDIKTRMLKKDSEERGKLEYWHSLLNQYAIGDNIGMNAVDYANFVRSIDGKTVVQKANEFLKGAIKVEVIMSSR